MTGTAISVMTELPISYRAVFSFLPILVFTSTVVDMGIMHVLPNPTVISATDLLVVDSILGGRDALFHQFRQSCAQLDTESVRPHQPCWR